MRSRDARNGWHWREKSISRMCYLHSAYLNRLLLLLLLLLMVSYTTWHARCPTGHCQVDCDQFLPDDGCAYFTYVAYKTVKRAQSSAQL